MPHSRSFAVASVCLLASACATPGASKSRTPAPAWFSTPPKAPRTLYFVGDATDAPDEGMARDLAQQKALLNLSIFVGAKITSDFQSVEQEHNGKMTQMVSMTVDLEGEELEIQQATVQKTQVHPGANGFDGYAMIAWPRSQYEAVLASRKNKAMRALAIFREAEAAATALKVPEARQKLEEARKLAGSMVAPIPLDDPQLKDSTVLKSSIDALGSKLDAIEAERSSVCAVGLRCLHGGKEVPCEGTRSGAIREAVISAGRKVAAEPLPASTVSAILTSSSPNIDASARKVGCIIAVQLSAERIQRSGPFTFAYCGARGVVFDTATGRIIDSHELPPKKVGHPKQAGAIRKGFDTATKALTGKLTQSLSSKK